MRGVIQSPSKDICSVSVRGGLENELQYHWF